jgi:hypothetical protein
MNDVSLDERMARLVEQRRQIVAALERAQEQAKTLTVSLLRTEGAMTVLREMGAKVPVEEVTHVDGQ